MKYLIATLAGYSEAQTALNRKVTKVGLRALAKADPATFIAATDWRDEEGGRYFTLAEAHRFHGPVAVQTRSFRNDTILFEYDGVTVTFR